jgi:hypothetical protein
MQAPAEEGSKLNGLWLSIIFDPEDGRNMFTVSPNSTSLKPRRP